MRRRPLRFLVRPRMAIGFIRDGYKKASLLQALSLILQVVDHTMTSQRVVTHSETGEFKPDLQSSTSEGHVLDHNVCSTIHSIVVENITKAYKLYDRPVDRLKESLHPFNKIYHRLFHALEDVSFVVEQGESVGIVGQNGAGKSTLLKIITGVLTPTSGNIQVNGHVSALLELGTGFNQELTGLENIFFNGAIMGFSKEEMEARIDDILSFADIGDFIHQPIKTYSSGMVMRLGFAVSVCVEPQIMIVDEMLAVGDAPFQAKCFTRLRKLIDSGVTILFTSHDISTVRSLCKRALWLEEGKTQMWGAAIEVCREYEKACWKKQGVVLGKSISQTEDILSEDHDERLKQDSGPDNLPSCRTGTDFQNHTLFADQINRTKINSECKHEINYAIISKLFKSSLEFEELANKSRFGTGSVVIRSFILTDLEGNIEKTFDYNDQAICHYLIEANESVDSDFMVGIRIRNLKDEFLLSFNDLKRVQRLKITKGGFAYFQAGIRLPLSLGKYIIRTGIFGFQNGDAFQDGYYDFGRAILYDTIENAAFIEVNEFRLFGVVGPVHMHTELSEPKLIPKE